jgi:uncharacterized membrane protein
MKYILCILAVLGILVSALALREHYHEGTSPCSINDKWDCGIVNHSPYAVLWGVPVAAIGMAGYLLLAVLAMKRRYRVMVAACLAALIFSLYLAHIEKDILGVWCIYCVCSLGIISLMTLLTIVAAIRNCFGPKDAPQPQ